MYKYTSAALLNSCRKGHIDDVLKMLKEGADPNTRDINRATLLMITIIYRRNKLSKKLIKAGADINAINEFGTTALMYASVCELNALKTLIKSGANINAKNKWNQTALRCSIENENIKGVSLLTRVIILVPFFHKRSTKIYENIVREAKSYI
jgi:ankyrin repeat protein